MQTDTKQLAPEGYRVAVGSISVPRARRREGVPSKISAGQSIPGGLFDQSDIDGWVREGRVVSFLALEAPQREAAIRKGKWCVNPASLFGLTMEELLLKVLEIDSNYEVEAIRNERDAVAVLTQNWHPDFERETLANASDTASVVAITEEGVKAAASRGLSRDAESALARARERAQAPKAETQD